MIKYFNKRAIGQEVERRMGITIPYITLHLYENNGYLKRSGEMQDGKRLVPVYTEANLTSFIKTLTRLAKKGKVRLTHTVKEE